MRIEDFIRGFKFSINDKIKYNDKVIGRILIDKPYPFALIKLFDPDFSVFKDKKLREEIKKEFDEIINYLPQKNQNILDIGSGLGIINIFLNNFYEDAYFTLIDKNYVEKKVSYGSDEIGQFYNDFNITFDFILFACLHKFNKAVFGSP